MEQQPIPMRPRRIADLVTRKEKGADVSCHTSFAVIPVDFQHRENPYRAHVFMCYFRGKVNKEDYVFRKCYAKGCVNDLCPDLAQAVMTANRYLQQDYRILKTAGIELEERLFVLEEILVKLEGRSKASGRTLTIDDYVNIAGGGVEVAVEIIPEYVPAVEHFANYKNAQTFLVANFIVAALETSREVQRCLACYASEKEKDEKTQMVQVANARLKDLFEKFDLVSIRYKKKFFY